MGKNKKSNKFQSNVIVQDIPNVIISKILSKDTLSHNCFGINAPVIKIDKLFTLDIQSILCKIILNEDYNVYPRWCSMFWSKLFKFINLTIVIGISNDQIKNLNENYADLEKVFLSFCKNFNSIDFINPYSYNVNWKDELLEVPTAFLSIKCHSQCIKTTKRKLDDFENSLPVKKPKTVDKFSRLQLLLSPSQMKDEEIYTEQNDESSHYEVTSDYYEKVTDQSPLFAIDCEMVDCLDPTNSDEVKKELVAVTVVNENREIVYSTYVKPKNQIVNYLTPFSGVDYNTLKDVEVTLQDVQKKLREILPKDAILAGHHIVNDLDALQIIHPYLIDTSVIYKMRNNNHCKDRLRSLVSLHLKRTIQNDIKGHDSGEDALATMDLVLLKLARFKEYGDARYSHKNHREIFLSERNDKKTIVLHGTVFKQLVENQQTINLKELINTRLNIPFEMKTVFQMDSDESIDKNDVWFDKTQCLMKDADGLCGFNINIVDFQSDSGKTVSKELMQQLFTKLIKDHESDLPKLCFNGVLFIDSSLHDIDEENNSRFSYSITK